jgi:hypothetical protein
MTSDLEQRDSFARKNLAGETLALALVLLALVGIPVAMGGDPPSGWFVAAFAVAWVAIRGSMLILRSRHRRDRG